MFLLYVHQNQMLKKQEAGDENQTLGMEPGFSVDKKGRMKVVNGCW